jgi:uncharacterized damage-inducible protein DinB
MSDFIEQSIFRMGESQDRIQFCLNKLSNEQIWKKPNASSNSVGNLTLHLCGNIRQYIHATLGLNPDDRVREEEFSASINLTRQELLDRITKTIELASASLKVLHSEKLSMQYEVQGFNLSGTGIILHVVEHLSYHTGQIALLTKIYLNQDLGFYKAYDLD